MPGVEARGFDDPDETRTPDKTKVGSRRHGGPKAARMTVQPGWKWSECIKPVVGTESCQARHVGVAPATCTSFTRTAPSTTSPRATPT